MTHARLRSQRHSHRKSVLDARANPAETSLRAKPGRLRPRQQMLPSGKKRRRPCQQKVLHLARRAMRAFSHLAQRSEPFPRLPATVPLCVVLYVPSRRSRRSFTTPGVSINHWSYRGRSAWRHIPFESSAGCRLWILAQATVVIRDRFLVFGRHGVRLPGARLARRPFTPQQKLQLVHRAEQFALHSLHCRRVARKTARIEVLHLACQFRYFFRRLRIVLDYMLQFVQLTHALLKGSFRIVTSVGRTRRHGPISSVSVGIIAGVDVAPHGAIRSAAITNIPAGVTRVVVADAIGTGLARAPRLSALLPILRLAGVS